MKKRMFELKHIATLLILFIAVNLTVDSLVEVYKRMQISSIYIKTDRDKIVVDAKLKPITVIKYKDGTEENIPNMNYTTSDEEVLKVTKDGIVAKRQGRATIKAKYFNKKAEQNLEVTNKTDFIKMLNQNHRVTFNWKKDNDIVKFWWSGADELSKFTILKKSGDSELEEIATNRVGNEFEDKLEDLNQSYQYKIYLLNEYGVSFEVKTVDITPEYLGDKRNEITDYKPIDTSKNESQQKEYSIKNEKDIKAIRNYKEDETYDIGESFKIDKENINKKILIKYNYSDESLANEDNLKVMMKDEDKKYISLQQEQIINKEENTIAFNVSNEGIYEIKDIIRDKEDIREIQNIKTEEETAKEFLANKDKSTMDVLVDCAFKVDKSYLEENKGDLKITYLSESKSTDFKDLGLYKVLENDKFTLIEDAVFDENNKLTGKDIKEGLYIIKEKGKVEDTDTVDFKNVFKDENGIYIVEKDREYLLKVINNYTDNHYKINADGFLEKINNENVENEYSKLIDSILTTDKKVTLSVDENWLYYSYEYNKMRQASLGEYSGVNIRKNNKESIIILGDIAKNSEIKEDNIKERDLKKHALVLFHELVHASRNIDENSDVQEEEKLAIDKENILRSSLGEALRSKEVLDTKDIINGEEIILYYNVDIEIGSSGAEVEELQQKLIRMGMDLGGYGATGYYGDYTIAAIKAIQQYKGYEIVGRYGTLTRGALNEIYAKIDGNDNYPEKNAILAIYRNNIIGLGEARQEDPITIGESGPRVIALQQKLLKLGFNLGGSGATGYYGFYTKTAILTIQEEAGLEQVGYCGPLTKSRIDALCAKVDSSGNYPEKATLLSKYSNNIINIELDPGASGIAVQNLQIKLMQIGFDLGGYGATGYFGAYTSMALMAIQKLYGLEMVGRYGPATKSKLNELFSQINVYGDYDKKEELQRIYQELLLDMELDPGQEGAAVEELQKKLMLLGFNLGGYGATGYFGQYTVAALSAIQEYFNLEVVGRYGPATKGKVKELLSKVDYNGYYPEKADLLRLYSKYTDILNGRDETINLTGNYNGNTVYYDQEDFRWSRNPYKDGGDNIGNSGCGVAAMAIVQSTMKGNGVNPVELAQYSINNGYCYNGTQRSFFANVTRESKYSLNTQRLPSTEIQTVKRLLSDGRHMAIAIMKPGHFTKGGHYIVLSGIETINNINYFNVLDPHMDNPNYGGDGTVIDDVKNDGRVKAKAGIFTREADEYWVFSTGGDSAQTDAIIEGKLNLEKLGYLGLRNSNWQLTSSLDSNFEAVKNKFLVDYGLLGNYNSIIGNKNTQLFIWIKQAVNGQRSRIIPTLPIGGDNGNNTNTEVINVGSVAYNFGLGMLDAAKGTAEGIWAMLSHPLQTLKNLGEAAYKLADMARLEGTSLEVVLLKQIIAAVSAVIIDFGNGNLNKQARMVGRLVGEILIFVIAGKGINLAIEGLQAVAKNSKFISALVKSKSKVALDIVEGVANATKFVNKTRTKELLEKMPELIGTTREKLLSKIQNGNLSKVANELYRPGATIGDGGTAASLVDEFTKGTSTHLQKAQERAVQLRKIVSSNELGLNDLDIAEALLDDLEYAISFFI